MPTLRLFGSAAEAAGTRRAEDLPGDTVGSLLQAARSRFGERFGQVLDNSRVWLNGEPTDDRAAIGEADEVAVLPPVSGGA